MKPAVPAESGALFNPEHGTNLEPERELGGIRECCHSVFSCSVKYLGLPRSQERTTVMEPASHGGCYMTDKARQSVTNSFRHSRLLPHRNTEQSWSLPDGERAGTVPAHTPMNMGGQN
jgi:hypothetical protein